MAHAGTVVHEIIDIALREFAKSGKYPDWKTMDDMFDPTWEAKVKEEEEKPWFIGWKWDNKDPEVKVRREYRPLVRIAREQALEKIRPWMLGNEPVVEWRIDLELQSDEGPFQLVGYADLLMNTGILCDWKTTHDEVSKRQKATWLQFAGYALWAWPIVGEENLQCQKIFLVRGNDPHVEFVPFMITEAHREWFCKVAAQVWKMVLHDAYLPGTDTWLCSPKFCEFWGPCKGELETKK